MTSVNILSISSHPTTLRFGRNGTSQTVDYYLNTAQSGGYWSGSAIQVSDDGFLTALPIDGYRFAGWFTYANDIAAQSGPPDISLATNLISDNTQLDYAIIVDSARKYASSLYACYPKYERITHTITLNPNGGSVTPTRMTVGDGESVTLPEPTWTGGGDVTFLGWHDGTQIVASTYTPTASVTLTAQWKVKSATGNLYITDGTEPVAVGTYSLYRDSYSGNYTVEWDVATTVNVPGLGLNGICTFVGFTIHLSDGNEIVVNTATGPQDIGANTIPTDAYVRASYRYTKSDALLYNSNNKLIYNTNNALLYGPLAKTNAEDNIYSENAYSATVVLSWGADGDDLDILAYWDSPNSGSPKVGYSNVAPGTVNGYTINWQGDTTGTNGNETLNVSRSTSIPGDGVLFVHLNFYKSGSSCNVTATQEATQGNITRTMSGVPCNNRVHNRATTSDPYVKVIFENGVLNRIETGN